MSRDMLELPFSLYCLLCHDFLSRETKGELRSFQEGEKEKVRTQQGLVSP
jgi:hypothetical protein